MQDILKLARKLGEAIAADPRYKAVTQIEEQVAKDEGARKLLTDFNQQQLKMAKLESEMKPIEPEDKRRLDDLHMQVTSNPLIKKLTEARFEFANLMRQVDGAIQSKFGKED